MDTLLWYWEISLDYVAQMLPCMVIGGVLFLALLPWRKRRLELRGQKSGLCREAGLLLFVLFCAGLTALTVFPASFWVWARWQAVFRGELPLWPQIPPLSQSVQHIQWIPTLFRGDTLGEWGLYMLLANTLIFLPVGFFPNLLWRPRWWKGLAAGFCTSFAVEFLQLFASRSTDIDDLILNTLGAFLGGLIALLLGKLAPKLTQRFQVEVRHGRETGDPNPAP